MSASGDFKEGKGMMFNGANIRWQEERKGYFFKDSIGNTKQGGAI